MRMKATIEEGAGSSMPQSVRRLRSILVDSRKSTLSTTPTDSETPTPSGSRHTTPFKRPRESSVMTDEPVSPDLGMPKPGEEVDTCKIQKINNNFESKCLDCFFMGMDL
jgi:hypothetical protein